MPCTEINASAERWDIMRRRAEKLLGYYVGLQSEFFEGKLRTIAGVRRNEYGRQSSYSRQVTNPEITTPWTVANTPLYGALYKLTPALSVFATYSESLEPQLGADADGQNLEPVNGKGYDIGLKSSVLDGRLSGTLTFYGIRRENLSSRDCGPRGGHRPPAVVHLW